LCPTPQPRSSRRPFGSRGSASAYAATCLCHVGLKPPSGLLTRSPVIFRKAAGEGGRPRVAASGGDDVMSAIGAARETCRLLVDSVPPVEHEAREQDAIVP